MKDDLQILLDQIIPESFKIRRGCFEGEFKLLNGEMIWFLTSDNNNIIFFETYEHNDIGYKPILTCNPSECIDFFNILKLSSI